MRTILIQLVFCLGIGFVGAQNITTAEYFFDSDPGIGNGILLTVTSNSGTLSQSFNIDVSGLSNGFHSLYIRTLNNEANWSLYDRSTFYIAAFNSGQNIVAAEYFYDTDNGIGTGTLLDVDPEATSITQNFAIPTTGLDEGFYSLYIRTQLEDGSWSLYDRQIIFVKATNSPPEQVVSAEYFIDSDPGIGMGIALSITGSNQVITFDTDGLSEGEHLFCVRVQNSNGDWSLYDCEIFNIDNSLGLEDSLYKSVLVKPNPFINSIIFEVNRPIVFQKISIYDITGKEVYTTKNNLRQINLDNLESGTYILHLFSENEKATFKIIKK